jgi:hypothetical protein
MRESTPVVERWLPVPGHVGRYAVSDLGHVCVVDPADVYSADSWTGEEINPWISPYGPHLVNLSSHGYRYVIQTAELVLVTFVGPQPSGTRIMHGIKGIKDHRLSNLHWSGDRSKECCPRNHLLISCNLVKSELKQGVRSCLACHRAHATRPRVRHPERPLSLDYESRMHFAAILGSPWGLSWARSRRLSVYLARQT